MEGYSSAYAGGHTAAKGGETKMLSSHSTAAVRSATLLTRRGVQHAAYNTRTTCGMHHASMRRTTFNAQHAACNCGARHATHNMCLNAAAKVQHITCNMRQASYRQASHNMHHTTCISRSTGKSSASHCKDAAICSGQAATSNTQTVVRSHACNTPHRTRVCLPMAAVPWRTNGRRNLRWRRVGGRCRRLAARRPPGTL